MRSIYLIQGMHIFSFKLMSGSQWHSTGPQCIFVGATYSAQMIVNIQRVGLIETLWSESFSQKIIVTIQMIRIVFTEKKRTNYGLSRHHWDRMVGPTSLVLLITTDTCIPTFRQSTTFFPLLL